MTEAVNPLAYIVAWHKDEYYHYLQPFTYQYWSSTGYRQFSIHLLVAREPLRPSKLACASAQMGAAIVYAHNDPVDRLISEIFHPAEWSKTSISFTVRSFAARLPII